MTLTSFSPVAMILFAAFASGCANQVDEGPGAPPKTTEPVVGDAPNTQPAKKEDGYSSASIVTGTALRTANACDLTGTFAVRAVLQSEWDETLTTASGGGTFEVLMTMKRAKDPTSDDAIELCAITLPDRHSSTLLQKSETWGRRFSEPGILGSIRSRSTVRRSGEVDILETEPLLIQTGSVDTSALPGAGLVNSLGLVPPLPIPNPLTAAGLFSGFDAQVKSGPVPGTSDVYSAEPLGIHGGLVSGRASEVAVALQASLSFSGPLAKDCSTVEGVVKSQGEDELAVRVAGCTTASGAPCAASQRDFLDTNEPKYRRAVGSTFEMKRIDADATCKDLRAVFGK